MQHKLIYFYDLEEWELFDLETDPHELKSVYDDPAYAKVRADMKKELDRLRKHYQDDGSVVEFDTARAREVKLQQVLGLSFDDETLNPAYNNRSVGSDLKINGLMQRDPSGRVNDQETNQHRPTSRARTPARHKNEQPFYSQRIKSVPPGGPSQLAVTRSEVDGTWIKIHHFQDDGIPRLSPDHHCW